jgi:hypothetical protein
LSKTQEWERDHPDDEPCPQDRIEAMAWRRARGLERGPFCRIREARKAEDTAKYEAAMARAKSVIK